MENTLIIVRGLPGSGKTDLAELLADVPGFEAPVFSADDYFTDRYGNYNWNPAKIGEAHAGCKLKTEDAMMEDTPKIFVANTFTQEKEIKPYQELAKKYGYRFVSVVVENRHGSKSIHNVPEGTVEKMKDRFSIQLQK